MARVLALTALIGLLFISQCAAQDVKGFYYWTWDTSKPNPPAGTNLGVAFSGYANPNDAVKDSASIKGNLPGAKYISIGGGDSSGDWSTTVLSEVTNCINNGTFSGYNGVCFDVEQGASGLESEFASTFQAARSKGFTVLVTISHSAPYGINDASTLMSSFFSNTNINYLSPQLYTSGTEKQNDYSTCCGVSWSAYKSSKAKIVPSIVNESMYADAVSYFAGQGITLDGYVQWAQ